VRGPGATDHKVHEALDPDRRLPESSDPPEEGYFVHPPERSGPVGREIALWDFASGRPCVAVFAALGVYPVLAGLEETEKVESFVGRWLGDLLAYDADRGGALVDTLSGYLVNGGSYDATATALNVHRSTLKYRLQAHRGGAPARPRGPGRRVQPPAGHASRPDHGGPRRGALSRRPLSRRGGRATGGRSSRSRSARRSRR
jgi:PucR C-terminal helix-turn-helix domain